MGILKMDPHAMALIVVDMQNDFVRRGAPFEIPNALSIVPCIKKLCDVFKQKERPIIFTRFVTGPCETLIWQWSQPLQPPIKACWRGVRRFYEDLQAEREGYEIIDELLSYVQHYAYSYVVDKYGYGAFTNTQLSDILRATASEIVVITGAAMPVCINETVMGAFALGYKVVVPADAVAAFAKEWSEYSLKLFRMKYGWVVTSDEVIRAFNHDFC